MSDWPSDHPTPPGDRTNLTPMAGNHPAEHNDIAGILVDVIAVLGADPGGSYTDVTQRLAQDPLLNEMGIFADYTARDAGAGARKLAFITGTKELQYLRAAGEWVTISQKVTVSASAPVGPNVGDLWLEPVA